MFYRLSSSLMCSFFIVTVFFWGLLPVSAYIEDSPFPQDVNYFINDEQSLQDTIGSPVIASLAEFKSLDHRSSGQYVAESSYFDYNNSINNLDLIVSKSSRSYTLFSPDSIGHGEPYEGYDSLCVDTDPLPTCTSNDFVFLEAYLGSDTLGTRLTECVEGDSTEAYFCLRFNKGNGATRRGFYVSATISDGDSSIFYVNQCFDKSFTNQGELILCIPDQIITFTCGTNLKIVDAYFGWGSSNAASNICIQTEGCASPKCDFIQGVSPLSTPLIADFEYTFSCPGIDTIQTLVLSDKTTGGSSIYSYLWDFGDGNNSTLKNPIHTYSDTGNYLVELIINDAVGLIDTVTYSVSIDSCSLILCSIQGDSILCSGDSLILSEIGGGSINWEWSGPGSFSDSSQNVNIFPVDTSMSGTYKVVISNKYGGRDSCQFEVVILQPKTVNLNYVGCQGDGYYVLVNGNLYDAISPIGTETMSAISGCDSIVYINLTFNPTYLDSINYTGCEGDGYSIMVGNTIYNESNPIGTDSMLTVMGCDSIIVINLQYYQAASVDAGNLSNPVCSNSTIELNELNAFITGGINTGFWTTNGSGSFDNNGNFGGLSPATTYTLSQLDIDERQVILTLTSHDPPATCEPEADAVLIIINDVECHEFPFKKN